METTHIRTATLADLPALVTIEDNSFPSDRFSRRQMRYLLGKAKAATFVAEWDQQVVGYAILLLPDLPRPARLYSIAVLPEFRGKHIAHQLLENVIALAQNQGYERVRLEVRETAKKTQALYREFDFQPMGYLPGYYANGDAALHMQKALHIRN